MLDVLKFKPPKPEKPKSGKGEIVVSDVSVTFGSGTDAHLAVETTSQTIQAGELSLIHI